MWSTTFPHVDVLSDEQVDAVHEHAMTLLEEVGVRFLHPVAAELLAAAGARMEDQLARLDRGLVLERAALAPRSFAVRGRNPERTVRIGEGGLAIAPTGGAPFVLDETGHRRPATLEDYRRFVRLNQVVPQLHLAMSAIVEPDDLPVATRHLDMDLEVIRGSDKPYFADGVSGETSRDCVDLAALAFGGREAIEREPVLLGIVNPISPLQFDERMAGSLIEFASAGQPVVLMPFVLAGATAPLGLAGALAQATAEALAGVTLVQTVRPGTPCVFGSFVCEIDLHLGTPIFGTAGSALAVMAAGQMSRRYGLPFRAGGALTARAEPDVRAAQESLMSLWPTLLSGPSLVVHGAGWVEGSLEASLEKLAQDAWPLEVFERLLTAPLPTAEEDFALDAFREVGPGGTFLGAAHTLRHVRESAATAPPQTVVGWRDLMDRYEEPALDAGLAEELTRFVERRKREIHAAA